MKYLGFTCGRNIECFCLLPSIDINWMPLKEGRFWDIRFCWFFWYITFGQIHKKLKEFGQIHKKLKEEGY